MNRIKLKTRILILTLISIVNLSIAQSSQSKEIISTIQELSTWSEVVFGKKMVHTTNIDYKPSSGKVIITELSNHYEEKFDKREVIFFLDDIDVKSFKYKLSEYDNLYMPYIEITTKNESVEHVKTSWDKGKEYKAFSEKSFDNKIRVFANMKYMSKFLAEKYVENWLVFSNCKIASPIDD